MTLPVSSYEELLAKVRTLTCETMQLQKELTSTLFDGSEFQLISVKTNSYADQSLQESQRRFSAKEKKVACDNKKNDFVEKDYEKHMKPKCVSSKHEFETKENPTGKTCLRFDEGSLDSNDWNLDNLGLWHSGPSKMCSIQPCIANSAHENFSSMITCCRSTETNTLDIFSPTSRTYSHQQLDVKVEMVYNLLSMLDINNREDMSKTFLAMSSSPESCHAMRQSGCLPLLIQLIHSPELDLEVRNRAAEALQNIVGAQADEKRRRREMRVLKLLQQIREFCDVLKYLHKQKFVLAEENYEKHPLTAMGALMKFSFDADHRMAICALGGLYVITELMQVDQEVHGNSNDDLHCITLRRYAGMSLTNLTFGDGKNKSLICSFNKFMQALVEQLKSPSEDLRQVTASVLRNLSWRADAESKQALRDVGAVTALTHAAMDVKKESTLKSILSALWNLSAHCSMNKADICSVPGALKFLVNMLKYKSTSNTLGIIENAGGIIRNISSHVAVQEDYRKILRESSCFEILLEHLKSPSLTIVSNACGTLWNLSARCKEDQKRLWEMGATNMLRSLIQSKHKMISMGSSAALKNLLAANPNGILLSQTDSTAKSLGLQNLPTLFVRKQRALEQELSITLSETCDNIESTEPVISEKIKTSTIKTSSISVPKRSDSHESIKSTQSDSVFELLNQKTKEGCLIESKNTTLHQSLNENQSSRKIESNKFMKRCKTSMIPTFAPRKINQIRIADEKIKGNLTDGPHQNTVEETDLKLETEEYPKLRDQIKRGIPVLKVKKTIKPALGFTNPNSDEKKEIMNFEKNVNILSRGNEIDENFSSSEKENCETLCQSECQKNVSHNDSKGSLNSLLKTENAKKNSLVCKKTENETAEEITFPDFKIGSEVMNSKMLQCDANKICNEIKKYQEMNTDLGNSLNSEISLMSCGSFLEAGDCSVFDCSSTSVDFEECENSKLKPLIHKKNFPSGKRLISQSGESVSLPSLGSIKSEQIEAIDLESSIISIASITSEIADVSIKEKNCCSIYTNTYKNDITIETPDETIGEFSMLSNEEETLNGDIIQNEFGFWDDDSSLKSQENLPADFENICPGQKVEPEQSIKKLTPKDKRKYFQERYKTYIIKDPKNLITPNLIKPEISNQKPQKLIFSSQLESNLIPHENFGNDSSEFPKYLKETLCDEKSNELITKVCSDYKNELLTTSKSFDGKFDHIQVRTPESKSLDDLLIIGPNERKELLDNAKLVAFSLQTAVHGVDSDLSSDCEPDEICKSLSIDTATYSKSNKYPHYPEIRQDELEEVNFIEQKEDHFQIKRPKILKPPEQFPSNISKGIRGKKKVLYSSALSEYKKNNNSTPGSPKRFQITKEAEKPNLIATKSLPNVSKKSSQSNDSRILQREGTFTKASVDHNYICGRNAKSIPVVVKNVECKRSSTNPSPKSKFTATPKSVKSVSDTFKSTKFLTTQSIKINEKVNDINLLRKKDISRDLATKNKGCAKPLVSSTTFSPEIKRSSSGISSKGNKSEPKSRNFLTNTSKSPIKTEENSYCLKEKGIEGKFSKSDVSSKIVNLWKKVEEEKKKTKKLIDNRIWINSKAPSSEGTVCIEQEEILEIPTCKIVHSFTSQPLISNVPKTRTDMDFEMR